MPRTRRVVISSLHRVSKDWSRCSAAVAATTGRAGSRSRWARWSPSASGSRKPTTKADGTRRQSTRSAAPAATSRSRPPRSHADQATPTTASAAGASRARTPRRRPSGARPGPGARRPTRPSTTSTARTARPWRHVSSSAGRGRTQSADGEQGERADPGEQRSALRLRVGCRLGGCGEPDDAVGVVDDAGVVGRDDDGRTLVAGRGEHARDGRPRQPVLPDRGLVGEHERGAVRDGGGHREAPLLAAGELARVGVGEVGEPERGEQGVGAAAGERRGRGRGRAASSARRRARCDRRARWRPAAAPRRRRARGRARTTRAAARAGRARSARSPASAGVSGSATSTVPRAGVDEAAERRHERGLAGAARADEGDGAAGPRLEVGAVDGERRARRARRAAGCGARPGRRRPPRRGGPAAPAPPQRPVPGSRTSARGSGSGTPGTQMPCAASDSPCSARTGRGSPSATTEPDASSTTRRSTRSSHPSRRCSTTTSVRPRRATTSATTARTSAAVAASSIAVGSSSSSTDGSRTRAPARASRWDSPPLSVAGELSADMVRPDLAQRGRRRGTASHRGAARRSPGRRRRPDRCSRRRHRRRGPAGRGRPSPERPAAPTAHASTVPDSSPASAVSSRPATARSRVDLPDPLGPASSTRSPGSMVRSRPSRTGRERPKGRHVRSRTRDLDAAGRPGVASAPFALPASSPGCPPRGGQTARCSRTSWPGGNGFSAPAAASSRVRPTARSEPRTATDPPSRRR